MGKLDKPHDVEDDDSFEAGEVDHLAVHLKLDLLVHVLAQLPPHQLPHADLKQRLQLKTFAY